MREAFQDYESEDRKVKQAKLDELVQKAKDLGADPEVLPQVQTLRAELAQAVDISALEAEVYSHLYSFFRRYYQEGDFISLRRYREGVYAIPYEGEEVKLHWANHDQYYIKTGEHFRDYAFSLPSGKRVHFKLVEADTEKDNKRTAPGEERRFILVQEEPVIEDQGELAIRFEYRSHPDKAKQADLNAEAVSRILNETKGLEEWRRELAGLRPTEKNPRRTLLEKHLADYTARNTFDYFVHKDLGGFLRRELDFYIKNEVMHLDDIESESAPRVEQYLSKVKALRRVAHKIIDFLAQIEDFQKKLWLKKKFVVETQYCITLGRILAIEDDKKRDSLLASIVENDAQREEWIQLHAIDEIEGDLVTAGYSSPLTREFLESHLTLMVDKLLSDDPALFIAIDDFEMVDLCELVDTHFPRLRREMIVINHHPQGGKAKTLANTHEYMLACVAADSDKTLRGRLCSGGVEHRPFKRSGTAESNFRYARPNSFYAIIVDSQTKTVLGAEAPPPLGIDYATEPTPDGHLRIYPLGARGEERVWRRSYESGVELIASGGLECTANLTIYHLIEAEDRTPALFSNWVDTRYNAGTFGANLLADIIGEHNPFLYPKSVKTVEDAIFSAGVGQDATCLDYFAGSGTTGHAIVNLNREDGGRRRFILVEMGDHFDTVLTPRMKKVTFTPAWKNGKPERIPTSVEAERGPHVVKVLRLESYEDTLNNLVLARAKAQQDLLEQQAEFREDYVLRYMLDAESQGSASLLNVHRFEDPFGYRLDIATGSAGETKPTVVDLVETFNYLVGLRVKTIDHIGGVRVVTGASPEGDRVLILWRNVKQTDNDALDAWFAKQGYNTRDQEFDIIYVNGDNNLENLRKPDQTWKVRLTEDDPDFITEYRLSVERSREDIIKKLEEVKGLIETGQLRNMEFGSLRIIAFDRHPYQPLIYAGSDSIEVKPVVLENEGERDFVLDLQSFCEANREFLEGKELCLLRNMSRGRGVGFFEAGNFYPDFILWLLEGGRQYVSFVDPKGLRNLEGAEDPKIQFYQTIKDLEARNVLFQAEDKGTYIRGLLDKTLGV